MHVLRPTAAALALLPSLLRHRRCSRLHRRQAYVASNSCCMSTAAFIVAPTPLPAAPDMRCGQQLLHERCCLRCCATAAISGSGPVLQPPAAARALLHSLLRPRRCQRLQTCAARCSAFGAPHSTNLAHWRPATRTTLPLSAGASLPLGTAENGAISVLQLYPLNGGQRRTGPEAQCQRMYIYIRNSTGVD